MSSISSLRLPFASASVLVCLFTGASAWAGLPATKATEKLEARSNDGRSTAKVKTWQLRGGTRITTEVFLTDGKRTGYSRTVERLNGSKQTNGIDNGAAFARASGWLGGAHLSISKSTSGYGYLSATNTNGPSYARFTGVGFSDEIVKVSPKR